MQSHAGRVLMVMMILPWCEGLVKNVLHRRSIPFPRKRISPWSSAGRRMVHAASPSHHIVGGVECVEVPMDIPSLGCVKVLEATAQAQDVLVNLALEEEANHQNGGPQLNAGDPYGSVLWPAAYAVAAKIMEDTSYKSILHDMTVLELGTGTGLVSLALAMAGAKHVIATDYEEIPLELLRYAASNLNDNCRVECRLLDMKDYPSALPVADLVVAADIMYEPKTGIAMAKRAVEAMTMGARVIVGDSPGRPGRNAFLQELETLGVVNASFVDAVGFTCTGDRHELICGKDSTSVSESPKELWWQSWNLIQQSTYQSRCCCSWH